ncbi:MAG: Hsp33 family molecular chaperone HslO [Streptococcaceae bacterium]|jgi:molecular chaperone Hsp33|nr:Hsp33 family molecular chaperone HslO [Streptococcaceae bacterium]
MDKLIKSISDNGHFRAFALDSTETVAEAQRRHETMASSTVALGRTLIAAQILGALEKGDAKITVKVIGDGPMGLILAVSDASGNVKGYVKNPDLDYQRTSTGEILVGELIGNGQLIVIKDMGLRTTYTGQVDLISAEIGEDLAWYFLQSEQTPSSVGVSVILEENADSVKSAGGFLLQALPEATDEEIAQMEKQIKAMPALSELTIDQILPAIYGNLTYKILEESPLAFYCDCSKSRFREGIRSLGPAEITAMIEENHGAEVVCQFCGRAYHFTEVELNDLLLEKSDL